MEVIDGKTGITRWCDNYDSIKLKCRKWQDEPAPHHRVAARHVPKSVAAINTAIKQPEETKTGPLWSKPESKPEPTAN
jgi:hypothetical protein